MDKLAPLSARAKQNPGVATFRYAGVKVAGTGGEREPSAPVNSQIVSRGAAKSGALDAAHQNLDAAHQNLEAELNEMTSIWPLLSADLRKAVLTIIRAGRNG